MTEGEIAIVIIVVLAIGFRIHIRHHAIGMVLRWLSENPQYRAEKKDIRFPSHQDTTPTIFATDQAGRKLKITLDLGRRWIRDFAEKAKCLSIEEIGSSGGHND